MSDSAATNESKTEKVPYDTPEQIEENFRRWAEAMEVSHAMLMAGLRDRVGPDGDVREAFRQWQQHHRSQKMKAYERTAERFRRRRHGCDADEASDAS